MKNKVCKGQDVSDQLTDKSLPCGRARVPSATVPRGTEGSWGGDQQQQQMSKTGSLSSWSHHSNLRPI